MHHISMTDIKQIADDIYSPENTKSHRDLVDNFEKHQQTIDTIDYNNNQDTYDTYSKLIGDYGIALAEIESYKKAIPFIDKALGLFCNNKKYNADNLRDSNFYSLLLFNRGRSYFYLDKYELAKPDFLLLTKLYPDNLNYAKWLNAINNRNLTRLKNILWYCVAGSLLIETFLNKGSFIKLSISGLGVLFLITVFVIEVVLHYKKKKYSA